MQIALIDTEEGSLSIDDLVKSGVVTLFKARTFADADAAVTDILKAKKPFDLVALDTVNTLATTTLNNITLDPSRELTTSIWSQRGAMKVTQAQWGEMSGMLIRLTRNLYQTPNRVILAVHEGDRENPYDGTDMHGPDLNKMLLKDIYGMADAVVRLGKLPQKAKIDDVEYAAGTRVLRLQDNPQYIAKGRDVRGHVRPDLLPNPTLARFDAVCNPPARKIVVYGPPGVGKTSFICSDAYTD